MTNCLYEHAEWIAPGNSMEQNFDSHLRISYSAFKLYREAMHLQYFPPTRYVRDGATRAHKRDDLNHI